MKANLPDLEKIYETAQSLAYGSLFSGLPDSGLTFIDISLDTFRQVWPDTGCGWTEPGQLTGQALTSEYTTVAAIVKSVQSKKAGWTEKCAYVIFFGQKGAYAVTDPKPEFFEDLKNRQMLGKYDALHSDRYSDDNKENSKKTQ